MLMAYHYLQSKPEVEQPPEEFYEKKVFLKISQNSQENICTRASFLLKMQANRCHLINKETLAQIFSCEYFAIFSRTPFLQNTSGLLLLCNNL